MFITVYRRPHHKLHFLLWVTIKKNVKNISQKVSEENTVAVEIVTDHEKGPQWRAGFCTLFLGCGVPVPFAVSWGLSQPVCMKPVGSVCGLQVQPFTSRNSYMKSIKHLYIHPYSSTASWLMPYQWMLQLGPWTFGEGNGNPLQCSCLENPMDRGAWWGCSLWGCKESDTTKQHTHTHTFKWILK